MIAMPRWLVAVLVAALIACLVAVAFLLGRESARPSERAGPSAAPIGTYQETIPARTIPPGQAPPQPATEPAAQTPRSAPVALRPAPPQAIATPPAAPVSTTPAAAPTEDLPDRPVVAAYFREVDNIHPGELSGDANQFAQELLNNAMSGDLSGFDRLIGQSEQSQARLLALSPPPACQAYHREAVNLTAESLSILRGMRQALAQSHADNFSTYSSRATRLQVRAQALEQRGIAIKRRYGIIR